MPTLAYLVAALAVALAVVVTGRVRLAVAVPESRPADLSRVEAITSAVLASLAAPPSVRLHRVVVVLPAGRLAGGAL